MVAVVTAVRGEVEGDGKALLPGSKIAPVEGVGFFRRRETGILPDRPGLLDIHGRIGAAQEWRHTRISIKTAKVLEVDLVVPAFD